ncbi:nucleotide exchange factors-like protein [Fomitopsis serialis]|uniref:nucleotide exchange factors-like protein n=1 Tax=Fomitopsis serialis TaxID=139415 RepID=UPI002007F09E|nr:nucleotide exchange factors-like protein [Neoantrodia serialis]KAH9922216.1 nucleotide exchange factors-like protein [Neoantrodia serialis]
MESLLRWSIEHSTNNEGAPPPPPRSVQNLDPGIIDAILGKPDSELMKEALAIATDESKDEDERIQALDNLEMLVEQIDNANNIEKMKMWEPLHNLLKSPNTTEGIKMQTLWVIGTAIQNNPSAQSAYLALSPMPTLLTFLNPSVNRRTALKSRIRSFGTVEAQFRCRQAVRRSGWLASPESGSRSVRRKTAFLLNTLIIPTTHVSQPAPAPSAGSNSTGLAIHSSDTQPPSGPVHPNSHASMLSDPSSISTSPAALKALEEHGILQSLVSAVTSPVPYGPDGESEGDADFDENVIRTLHTYATSCDGRFSAQQKTDLRAHVKDETDKAGSEPKLAEKWGLTTDELTAFKQAIA